MLRGAIGDELMRDRETVNKSGAGGLHVEGAALRAERMLHEVRGRREGIIV